MALVYVDRATNSPSEAYAKDRATDRITATSTYNNIRLEGYEELVIHTHTYIYIHIYIHTYIYIYIHTHTHTHTYIYITIQTHIHIYVYIPS